MSLPAFPDSSSAITLVGPAGALEAAVDLPEPDAAALPLVAIVCHPLPTEGGTMHNKVVTMVARSLRELGATTVRFNFRGTGASEGQIGRASCRERVEVAAAGAGVSKDDRTSTIDTCA